MQLSDDPENLPSDRFWVKREGSQDPAGVEEDIQPDLEAPPEVPRASPEVPREGRGSVGLLVGGLVIALALAAVFGVLWLRNASTSPDDFTSFIDESSPDVEKTATSVATLMMNYDSTNLQQVGEQILELSTGDFAADYQEILLKGLGAALEGAKASSRGQILSGPDIYFQSGSQAIALMQIVQTTQSEETPGGQSFKYQMKITLIEVADEGWKAAKVDILSQERTS